jgi:hypothetical protein
MLDSVANWPVVAIETGLGAPKNVAVKSKRKILVIESAIHVEQKAMVRAGTKNFPAVDLLSMFCCILVIPYFAPNAKEAVLESTFYDSYRINNLSRHFLSRNGLRKVGLLHLFHSK